MPSHVPGHIYLIHFVVPYKHARHYLGWASDLAERLARHRAGNGSRLMSVITEADIAWELARVWEGDRFRERRLKNQGGRARLCPICRGTGAAIEWDHPQEAVN